MDVYGQLCMCYIIMQCLSLWIPTSSWRFLPIFHHYNRQAFAFSIIKLCIHEYFLIYSVCRMYTILSCILTVLVSICRHTHLVVVYHVYIGYSDHLLPNFLYSIVGVYPVSCGCRTLSGRPEILFYWHYLTSGLRVPIFPVPCYFEEYITIHYYFALPPP